MSASYKRRRRRLFLEQGGRCFWCNEVMILMNIIPPEFWKDHKKRGTFPRRLCTIDHIRGQDKRITLRLVAACFYCNNERAKQGL